MRKFFKDKLTLKSVPILFVLSIFIFSFAIIGLLTALLLRFQLYAVIFHYSPILSLVSTLMVNGFIGMIIATILGKKLILPIRKIIEATQKVTEGDFSVKLDVDSIREIEALQVSFNKMTAELNSVETLRSDFISNFSHEFKTPIVSIRGFAKLLLNEDLPIEDRNEYLSIIIEESERLTNLSTNILDLSKVENIEIAGEKSLFDLDEQIRRVIAMMDYKWQAKNINLNINLENIEIVNDDELLSQVWINLIDNAIKFSHYGGDVDIDLKEDHVKNEVVFTIRDYGVGMSEETQKHLFDKFYQGDKSHALKGNGLGLALVKRIMEICDGEIKVDSSLDNGSEISVHLKAMSNK